jgi:hypothetical protein
MIDFEVIPEEPVGARGKQGPFANVDWDARLAVITTPNRWYLIAKHESKRVILNADAKVRRVFDNKVWAFCTRTIKEENVSKLYAMRIV